MTVDPHPPGQAGADPVPSARLRAAVPLGALALALLLAIVPLHDRLADALNDALLGWFSTPAKLNDVLVIDIDDISLHEVKPWLGPWPFRRETHALMIDFLREAGASVIGIAIVFTDAREGDEELKRALAGPGAPVVLAAAGLRQPVDAEHDAQRTFDALAGLHTSVAPASAPASHWPALALPSAGLLAALPQAPRLGVISAPLSDDGRLRRLPLLHEVNGRLLTAFPLTMQLATMAQPRLDYDAARRVFNAGSTPWPVDSQGMAGVAFPRAPDALQHLRYSELAAAMLGRRDANALRQLIKGRAVFVGSSAFFGDGVMTAAGQLSGTALLALSYAALRDGSLNKPGDTSLGKSIFNNQTKQL